MVRVAGAAQSMPPDDPASFAAAHRRLLADTSIQFDLAPPPAPPQIPGWLKSLVQFLSSPAAEYLFWAGVVVIALIILYHLIPRLLGFRWPWTRTKETQATESWQPEENVARALLHEADALAARGRFDEAARLLLFRSIEDIDSRRPQLVQPALTSRDIANAPGLPDRAREAFTAISMMVERSLFGGRSLAEGDWRSCRSAYEHFAFAEAWA